MVCCSPAAAPRGALMALVLFSAPKICNLPQKCPVWLWHTGRDSGISWFKRFIFTLLMTQRFLPNSLYCLTREKYLIPSLFLSPIQGGRGGDCFPFSQAGFSFPCLKGSNVGK